ncbi:ABC transporter G family member 20-like isoform X3 [Dermatophagoides pteronyssinus]|uniref:ABC transporter G family member 20-like isoform X3 n=1 Tax=Dermatophagoides pteronyssinus TaxID=6956 RepID=UPI003F670317
MLMMINIEKKDSKEKLIKFIMDKRDIAIEVKNVSFKYHKSNVLQDIHMTVPKRCIYALLGPSGSGKTTLLRLMLGRVKLNHGTIEIFGHNKPGHYNRVIGYMPQSQALSPELTIRETFDYFASLYQLSETKYLEVRDNLKKIFCLPEDEQVVSTLSGGQQKALSLALVFLHSPKLVFLDEPTVGTDPVLGNQIWTFLRKNADNGLTVIIVTHYIQEASLADRIGMMRGGRMIEEGMPKSLYSKYNETNLETIFIHICTQKPTENEIQNEVENTQRKLSIFLPYKRNSIANAINNHLLVVPNSYMRRKSSTIDENQLNVKLNTKSLLWLLFILIRRNIYQFFQSKFISVMVFSPTFCTLLMCIIFKVDMIRLNTAVFNEDVTRQYSQEFQNRVKNFSLYHVNYIQFDSLDEAVDQVRNGHATAAIWFHSNFSSALIKRALAAVNADSNSHDDSVDDSVEDYVEDNEADPMTISNRTLDASTIKLFADNANAIIAQPLLDLFKFGTWELYNQVFRDEGQIAMASPVVVKEVVYADNIIHADFLLPGYIIGFLYLALVTITSQLLIMERNDGFFDRAIVAGAKHSLMFFSHFIANLLFAFFQIVLMFLIGFAWYRMNNFGSYSLMFFLVLMQSASAIMTGLLISATCEVNFSAFFIALSVTLSQLFTSGAFFPIVSFDPLIKFFLSITPIAMPVESLRNVMLRGWNLNHFHVVHGLLANIGTTIVFGLIALYFFKRKS